MSRSFWIAGPGKGEIRQQPLGPVGAGQAKVRTLYSAVSLGTETLVYQGLVPSSEHQRMRAPWQEGDFPGPVKYGYISVGVVEEGPSAFVNQQVFCLYPHQTRYVVDASALTLLPPGLPAERAVLTAGMETAINALWDAAPKLGDRIYVVGAGVIGCLCAYLATRVAGCEVTLLDINPERKATASALGVDFVWLDKQGVPGAPLAADADLVIHASGSESGLQTALALAGKEAAHVEVSWFGEREVRVPLGAAFHSQRLQIVSSQVGSIPASQRARWTFARRLALALKLLQDADLDTLISGESEFEQLPATMAKLIKEPGALCHRVSYSQKE